MDADHFDTLTRRLTMGLTRRRSLALLATLGLSGLASPGATEAKKKKACPPCKKRKKGKCKGTLPDGTGCTGGTCTSGRCAAALVTPPPQPFCTGKNTCATGTAQCDVEGRPGFEGCFCYVSAVNEQSVCGQLGDINDQVPDCALCSDEKICVEFDGCGGSFDFFCLTPCPDPL